jgi:hypothetical protein
MVTKAAKAEQVPRPTGEPVAPPAAPPPEGKTKQPAITNVFLQALRSKKLLS